MTPNARDRSFCGGCHSFGSREDPEKKVFEKPRHDIEVAPTYSLRTRFSLGECWMDSNTTAASHTASDAELVAQVRQGNRAAFELLYARHVDIAQMIARKNADNPGDVEDVVSEAFQSMLQSLLAGKGPDAFFRAYLISTVKRVAHHQNRKAGKVLPTGEQSILDQKVSDDDRALKAFESRTIARAFRSLPERWQSVLWYVDVERMKPAAAAPALGLSPNAVSALAVRAREGLRREYLQLHVSEITDPGCAETSSNLAAYLRRALPRKKEQSVRAHLDECIKCTGALLDLRDVQGSMRATLLPIIAGVSAAAWSSGTPTLTSLPGQRPKILRQIVRRQTMTMTAAGAAVVVAAVAVAATGMGIPAFLEPPVDAPANSVQNTDAGEKALLGDTETQRRDDVRPGGGQRGDENRENRRKADPVSQGLLSEHAVADAHLRPAQGFAELLTPADPLQEVTDGTNTLPVVDVPSVLLPVVARPPIPVVPVVPPVTPVVPPVDPVDPPVDPVDPVDPPVDPADPITVGTGVTVADDPANPSVALVAFTLTVTGDGVVNNSGVKFSIDPVLTSQISSMAPPAGWNCGRDLLGATMTCTTGNLAAGAYQFNFVVNRFLGIAERTLTIAVTGDGIEPVTSYVRF